MQIRKILITLSLIIFLLVGAAGVAYSGVMMPALHSPARTTVQSGGLGEGGGHGMGDMIGCPLMSHSAAICNMSPLEHLAQWQHLFAAIPAQSMMLLLLLLLFLLALFFRFRLKQHLWLFHPSPQLVYVSSDPEAATHDSLQRFIMRGLMHPKIF